MIYLIGSIVLTSYLTLSFKMLDRLKIPVLQSIVFNYWTCVAMGSVVNGHFPINAQTVSEPWFKWACIMGVAFISLFNLIAFVTQRISVAVASVANKLSLLIPFVFSLYLYNEQAGWLKIAGIALALAAVLLTCWPQRREDVPNAKPLSIALVFLLPALLFVGSGLLDTLLKYVEQSFLNDENKNEYLITSFATAGAVGLLVLLTLFITGKQKLSGRAVLAGLAIGIPNYFSIWCLVRVLKQYQGESSAIIPVNNMGIVLFSTVMAWLLFREKLSATNRIGILLSLGAIALIAFG